MSNPGSQRQVSQSRFPSDRRADCRQTAVLRVGLLTNERGTSFCLLNNVSANGFQARIYGDVRPADQVTVDVPDENKFLGTVIWCREGNIGVRLKRPIDPSTVLRLNSDAGPQRRRRLPRIQLRVRVALKIGERSYKGDLQDISSSGALVATTAPIADIGPVILILPGFGPIKGQVRWQDELRVGIFFNTPVALKSLANWLVDKAPPTRSELAA